MPRRLSNDGFGRLRSWLFPTQAGSISPPTLVSDELVVTVDSERWVPVPRFGARSFGATPGVGRNQVINLEVFTNLGGIAQFTPSRFVVTDLIGRVDSAGTGTLVSINTRNGGNWTAAANLAAAANTRVFSGGDQPQLAIQQGDIPTPGPLTSGPVMFVDATQQGFFRLPDVSPGQCVQLVNGTPQQPLFADFYWVERRAPGVPAP